MKIKMLKEEGKKASFLLEDTNPTIANALRRAMISLVPTLAIEDVLIEKNGSALYNEVVAHRLGLIPLKTDLEVYEPRKSCECEGEGCKNCEVHFELEEKGPKTVKAKDIKPKTDKKIEPVYPGMPIVKLREGQEIKMELIAVVDNAKEHTKWSPCFVTYRYYPIIETNDSECEEAVEACPRDILEVKNGKVKVKEENLLECNLCEACEDACEDDKIKAKGDRSRIIFEMESWGQLPSKEIIERACDILQEQLDDLKGALSF